MKALILSGGTGSRLRPFTYTSAKQLIPIANKPILFLIIEKLLSAGISDIGIIVGSTQEQIKSVVGNGEKWGVQITYIHQAHPLGLAHAVKTASNFIGTDDFLMLLGDNLFQMELNNFIDSFYRNSSNAAILLHRVKDPSQFGVAVIDDNRIIKLVEKPKTFTSDLIITGIYIFDKNIFAAIDSISASKRGELEITDAIQRLLETGGKISYELIQGWWKDTGNVSDILEANRLVLDDFEENPEDLSGNSIVKIGKVIMGKNVTVKNSIICGPSAIDDNAVIVNSTIGPYTSIGTSVSISNCNVRSSIILEGTIIENIDTPISSSFMGKNTIVRRGKNTPASLALLISDNCEVNIPNDKQF